MSMRFTLVVGTAAHCSDTPLQAHSRTCAWLTASTCVLLVPKPSWREAPRLRSGPFPGSSQNSRMADVGGRKVQSPFSIWGHLCRVIPAPEFPVKLTDTSGVSALQLSFSLCLSLQPLFPHRCLCQEHSLMNHLQAILHLWIGFPGNPHCSKNFSLQQDWCFISHVVYC